MSERKGRKEGELSFAKVYNCEVLEVKADAQTILTWLGINHDYQMDYRPIEEILFLERCSYG